ncbi:hypothetical protein [Caulobacter vibrioides]|uniref:Uncharacterized protein n=1 Tax=Caulobacter phage S2B TaxID=2759120 RepID=A0AAE7MLB7_9CAUD|nr:hypothetical protein [Caulobacter vibrioides]QOC54164.1 hypothetical protein [Caulobacter phage S2B]QXZ53884.1 hypothetical protein KZH45_09525 [Caulobacter vibrioides]
MTRAIRSLLNQAVAQFDIDGIVATDLQMKLAAEGYDLGKLDADIETVIAARAQRA